MIDEFWLTELIDIMRRERKGGRGKRRGRKYGVEDCCEEGAYPTYPKASNMGV